jgi:TetR/AcrR family transcriptional repressor of nem operon
MPYSKQHKQETRERILQTAAHALREAGLHGIGIGELMAQAGLTHGGFYAHFPSKDALLAEACARGMAESGERLFAEAATEPPPAGLSRIIRAYLSRAHRDTPATGCVLPALAADVARAPREVRTAFTDGLRQYLERLEALIPVGHEPGDAQTERDATRMDEALVLLSGMVGALLLARAVDDAMLSDRLLASSRAFYCRALGADTGAARSSAGMEGADAMADERAQEREDTGAFDGE